MNVEDPKTIDEAIDRTKAGVIDAEHEVGVVLDDQRTKLEQGILAVAEHIRETSLVPLIARIDVLEGELRLWRAEVTAWRGLVTKIFSAGAAK